MSMIDRYKKKGGFLQLLNLIETTGSEKREKFLKLIADENPAWEAEIKKKMLTMEKISGWNSSYLMEIFPHVPLNNMAAVIAGLAPDKQALFISALGFSERKKIDDILKEKKPSPGEINSSIMKLMSEIRAMVAMGQLKFEKFDQDMVVPENIEELLSSGRPLISDKEVAAHFSASSTPTTNNNSAGSSEELTQLRKKLVQLSQENQKLNQDNTVLKDKLEQIRKIA